MSDQFGDESFLAIIYAGANDLLLNNKEKIPAYIHTYIEFRVNKCNATQLFIVKKSMQKREITHRLKLYQQDLLLYTRKN